MGRFINGLVTGVVSTVAAGAIALATLTNSLYPDRSLDIGPLRISRGEQQRITRNIIPTPTESIIPLQRETPIPIPPTATPTQVVYGIKEENLERTLTDLFAYYYVDERDKLVERIRNLPIPNLPTDNKELESFESVLNDYKTTLIDLLSRFADLQEKLEIFNVIGFNWGTPCEPILTTDVSYKENVTQIFSEIEEKLEKAQKYGDPTLITHEDLKRLSILDEFTLLNATYGDCPQERAYPTWAAAVTPSAKIIYDYFKGIGYNARWFDIELNRVSESLRIIGSLSGNLDQSVVSRSDVTDSIFRGIRTPIKSDNYLDIALIGDTSLNFSIIKFDGPEAANETWERYINSGELKIDEEECFLTNVCLKRIYWKKSDNQGNYYAYGQPVGEYVLIIGPSENIWESVPAKAKEGIQNMLNYLSR